jgi:hypothetical protein
MKKFNVIEFSDCRGCSEVNKVWDIEGKSGEEVFNLIIEGEIKKSDGWIEYVSDMICEKDNGWVEDREYWKEVFCIGGKMEGSEYCLCMMDELREFMIIREDSKYYNKFKRDVDERDDENVDLYYNIIESEELY